MVVVKKYGNRRLYDTEESRYVTLDELTEKIRRGAEVRVEDAKTGADLTQATLAQIVLESRGAAGFLPVPLLLQLIRMNDEALSEFLGRYLAFALELYREARQGAQQVAPYNPFATLPFSAGSAMARLFSGALPWSSAPVAPPPAPPAAGEVEELRRRLDELERRSGKKRRR